MAFSYEMSMCLIDTRRLFAVAGYGAVVLLISISDLADYFAKGKAIAMFRRTENWMVSVRYKNFHR